LCYLSSDGHDRVGDHNVCVLILRGWQSVPHQKLHLRILNGRRKNA
jgi:hypothetical protein